MPSRCRKALIASMFWIALAVPAAPGHAAHVQCGDVITQDTTLDSDLTCAPQPARLPALLIGAHGVTLDLDRHTVRRQTPGPAIGIHPSLYGGDANPPRDLTIENGRFDVGSISMGGSGPTMRKLELT